MPRPFTRRAFIASLACATSAAAAGVMTACSKTDKGANADQTAAFPDVIPLREGREEPRTIRRFSNRRLTKLRRRAARCIWVQRNI